MDNNRYSSYDEEVKVNLIDMMFYLLGHWRTLIGAVALGILLGGIIVMVKSPKEEITVDDKDQLIEDGYLPDERTMNLAYKYRTLYYTQCRYNEDSIIMQMDPLKVYTGKLEYYIEAGENTRVISNYLRNILEDDAFLQEIKRAGKLGCELQYVRELLSCSLVKDNDYIIDFHNGEEAENDSYNAISMIVDYTVLYPDERTCQAMLRVVSSKVDELNEELQEQYGEYEFTRTCDTVQVAVNTDVLNKQKNNAENGRTFLNNLSSLENGFADKDRKYYEMTYLEMEDEETGDLDIEKSDEGLSVKEMVKWLILGVFLTCVCWGGYYFIKYLLDRHVKSAQELQDVYGLHLLGRVELSEEKQKGVDRFLSALNRKRKGCMDSMEYVATSLNALEPGRILLCMDNGIEMLQILSEGLKKYYTSLMVGNMVHDSIEALKAAKAADGIILAVAVGETTHEEIKRDLDVCRLQEIPVLGVVVVEKL